MKRNAKRIFSLLLTVCMIAGMLPLFVFQSVAAETDAKDYDAAEDGELLYWLNFKFNDTYTKHLVDKNVTAKKSESGHKLTFSQKETGAPSYYGGFLKSYRITGHVYTISYYTENSSPAGIRGSLQVMNDGCRIGVVNRKANTTDMDVLANGTTGEAAPNKVSRKVDKENNNREYFKVVVDGVNLRARFYALDTNDTYSLLVELALDYSANHNYLAIGLYNWDILTGENVFSVGDVKIFKGDEFAVQNPEKTAYQQQYDALKDGDTIYAVNFNDLKNQQNGWTTHRKTTYLTPDAVSENGDTLTLNFAEEIDKPTQVLSAYFPAKEAIRYGAYTYEFFIKSDKRVGMNVLGTTGMYAAGFSYFNSTAANQFMLGAAFKDSLTNDKYERCSGTSFVQNQSPSIKDETKPNVKIEVDTLSNTVTNYILNDDGVFVKTAEINYGGSSFLPIVYPYAWDLSTNAVIKDMKIVKGLSVSGEPKKLMDLRIDGSYTYTVPQIVTDSYKLPTITVPETYCPDFYTAVYQTADGTTVSSVADLALKAGYNSVELKTVYTAKPIETGSIEIRAVQTKTYAAGDATTSVRFIAALNSLDFEAAGCKIFAVYRNGNQILQSTNELNLQTTVVYSSVLAGAGSAVTAEYLGGTYLCAFRIDNIPVGENVQVDLFVTPYTVAEGADATNESNYQYGYESETPNASVTLVDG